MRFFILPSIVLLFFSPLLTAQIKVDRKQQNVSDRAFSKKVTKDFNYLILGENSPQQGISTTLNEDKTNLKISGNLFVKGRNFVSIEADLSASNGIFFFDKNNGSDKGKITINYFFRKGEGAGYYKLDGLTRAKIKLEILELLTKAKSDYLGLKGLLEGVLEDKKLLEKEDKDEALGKIQKLVDYYLAGENLKLDNLGEREFKNTTYELKKEDELLSMGFTYAENGKEKNIFKKNNKKLNLSKLLNDFLSKQEFILKKLDDSIQTVELNNAEKKWASTRFFFWGISPFYERQSLKRFSFDSSMEFDKMFIDERGNSLGVTTTFNFSQNKEQGSQNIWKPESIFLRVGASLARSSNISSFKNSTLGATELLGNDVEGNPVQLTSSNEAFIKDTPLEFGIGTGIFFEGYLYPFKSIGIFTRIGYEKINFIDSSDIDDISQIPMRAGILFNLKNKEKDKPIITIQAFLDRTNLKLDSSEPDNDLRFGIGVGLPINIRPR